MTPEGFTAGDEPSVDAADAIRRVDAKAAWLLDVREASEWQAGHAPAAHHIPMGEVQARQDEIPVDEPLLVICHSGQRSRAITNALLAAGYPVANVGGGMEAWHAAGGPITVQSTRQQTA